MPQSEKLKEIAAAKAEYKPKRDAAKAEYEAKRDAAKAESEAKRDAARYEQRGQEDARAAGSALPLATLVIAPENYS